MEYSEQKTMRHFNVGTTFKEFKVMLEQELTLEYLGVKKPKYTTLMNIKLLKF
jgi:hypothetical protein